MLNAKLEDIAVASDGSFFLMLIGTDKGDVVPITIGALEAYAISVSRQEQTNERPLTADLLVSTVEILGATIKRIELTDLKDGIYFARVIIENRGIEFEIDARPSDALALQVRTGAPLYIAESVVEAAGLHDEFGPGGAEA
jgi:bifunctional DNase/RNase